MPSGGRSEHLDEIKDHQGVPGLVLRSQHPRGVEQETFASLLADHALRDLKHQAALHAGHDPDRVSFPRTLRVVRRHVTGPPPCLNRRS